MNLNLKKILIIQLRISFFNNDTAIITGYIQSSKKMYSNENGYYFTKNNFQDIKSLSFGKKENEWIYDVFIYKEGIGWMGGSSGNIYYTSNFGKSWKKLNSPFDKSSRTHSIYMINNNEGIAGALANLLFITKDNWKNYSKIETPLDQNLNNENQIRYNDVEKIRKWKDYYVIKQGSKIFYSKIDKIEWKEFIINLIDFEIDRDLDNLFAITTENKAIQLENIDTYKIISTQKIVGRIKDMKVVNNSVYLFLTNSPFDYMSKVAKINSKEFFQTYLFTEDKQIEINNKIVNGKNLQWSFNNNYIYVTENGNQDWYREAQLNYNIEDLSLLNDSTAIVWNKKDNYLYSTSTKQDLLYYPKNPLSSFFLYPIKA